MTYSIKYSKDVDKILKVIESQYSSYNVTTIDGVKIDFPDKWVHLRKSNTEPIIRIYSEAKSESEAQQLAEEIMKQIKNVK